MRFFNIAGPCNPIKHYMLPATERLIAEDVMHLIEQEAYFILHAPRQTGKTTAMHELAKQLTASGKYIAILVTMEVGAAFPNDTDAAEQAILSEWRAEISFTLPKELHPPVWLPDVPAGQRIGEMLGQWALTATRPVVIFMDEIDALQDEVLISVLRQLRTGFFRRPEGFPSSLAIIGLRDVRDYKVASGGSERLSSPSPFNIATRSITLRNFSSSEVTSLLQQHLSETGQHFTASAMAMVFEFTNGQPWLVNALAKVATEELVRDRTQPIEVNHIEIIDISRTLVAGSERYVSYLFCSGQNWITASGMLKNPSDRKEAVRPLIEAAGGKLVEYYVTLGETDFLLITETDDSEGMMAALIVAGASGGVSNMKTVQAFSAQTFVTAQKRAGSITSFKGPNQG